MYSSLHYIPPKFNFTKKVGNFILFSWNYSNRFLPFHHPLFLLPNTYLFCFFEADVSINFHQIIMCNGSQFLSSKKNLKDIRSPIWRFFVFRILDLYSSIDVTVKCLAIWKLLHSLCQCAGGFVILKHTFVQIWLL